MIKGEWWDGAVMGRTNIWDWPCPQGTSNPAGETKCVDRKLLVSNEGRLKAMLNCVGYNCWRRAKGGVGDGGPGAMKRGCGLTGTWSTGGRSQYLLLQCVIYETYPDVTNYLWSHLNLLVPNVMVRKVSSEIVTMYKPPITLAETCRRTFVLLLALGLPHFSSIHVFSLARNSLWAAKLPSVMSCKVY